MEEKQVEMTAPTREGILANGRKSVRRINEIVAANFDHMVKLRDAGKTYRELSEMFSVPTSSLIRRLRRYSPRTRSPWTEKEDELLSFLVASGASLAEMMEALKRSKSAVYVRAVERGLGVGPPPDTEFLTTAATRTGYAAETLRGILKWARVKAVPSFSKHASRPCYEVVDVDDAIARWHTTETVNGAAQRLGVSTNTLYRLLRAKDLLPPKRSAHRTRFRIASEVLERVVREYLLSTKKRRRGDS